MHKHFVRNAEIQEGKGGTYVKIELYSVTTGITSLTFIQISSGDLLKRHYDVIKFTELQNKQYVGTSADSHDALCALLNQLRAKEE